MPLTNTTTRKNQRLRLRASKDAGLVLAQGATSRSYRPFAQVFGTQRVSQKNAALIIKAVNYHNHLIKAMEAVQRGAQLPTNWNDERLRKRLALIGHYAAAALAPGMPRRSTDRPSALQTVR
jgi:hypothetical protein